MLSRLLVLSSSSSCSLALRPAVAWLAGGGQHQSSFTRTTSIRYQSTTTSTPTTDDDSAMARSRAPFRMPRNSPDDSVPQDLVSSWNQLGLWTELVDSLTRDMKLEAPTPVQSLVIPSLLKENPADTAFLAATGSGKTLAYCLPLLQQLKTTEVFGDDADSYETRKPKRPRLLIIAPTRELVTQIRDVVKLLCHSIKLSSHALVGGQDYGKQRKALNRPVDVVVSTPGRLLQHWKEGHVFFGDVQYIVLDEMDTLLEQGFQKELQQLLYPLLWQKPLQEDNPLPKEGAPRIILTSATMTQAIQKIVSPGETNRRLADAAITAKRHFTKPGSEKTKVILPKVDIVKAPGLHKAVPRLEQIFVDVGNIDKISLLVDIVSAGKRGNALKKTAGNQLTMVFCNTAASCRAAQYALSEAQIDSLSYHGDLNSIARAENLKKFRNAGEDPESTEPRVLVCTDLGARGLDVPQVDHVVMFDFPLNSLDYLHRSGRTARGVADATTKGKGKVTALVSKRDKVLAAAIENAVLKGEPLDGLSSRKSDYLPGGRLDHRRETNSRNGRGGPRKQQQQRRGLHTKGKAGGQSTSRGRW
ncbi:dependent RNA helicase [Seminavis robusta]|uniref:Dependent RNA helicase n=1 Tax=Seminavis robusta TaxID=568900 RepID=A0A9N8HUX9_9STRA|nr:dependent RNA helicase [Seminavis robusta]|eukprot:Sro1441_g272930.1 dependent RNA helicase (586) ;mRNA; r:11430-13432